MGTEFGKILETDGGDGGTGTGMNVLTAAEQHTKHG